MNRLAVCLGLAFASNATLAAASDLCSTVEALTAEAGANFADRPITGNFNPGLPNGAQCAVLLQLGGVRALNCQWGFSFRNPDAWKSFERLSGQIRECSGVAVLIDQDQLVNHPDTYDLRKFDWNGAIIDVSLKDKGALQQTFVFLRVGTDAQ